MPLSRSLLDEMAAARDRAAREADRERRRDLALTAVQCVGWCALGLACLAWGLHTTDGVYGRLAFWVGVGVGNAGWLFTVLAAYRRGEQRGDW